AHDLSGFCVASAVSREAVEPHRLPPDHGALSPVPGRPAERVQAARNYRDALLQRDHQTPRLHRAGVPESLPRPLQVNSDQVAVPREPARLPQRVAVSLAPPHAEDAQRLEPPADDRNLQEFGLGEEVDDARTEPADQRVVDSREVIRGHDAASLERHALDAVAGRRREPDRHARDEQAADPPAGFRAPKHGLVAALEQPQPVLELGHAQLDLLELAARHEPDLAEDSGQAATRALAQPDGLAAPAAHQLLDHGAGLVAADPTAGRDLLGEGVRALRGQRDGADPGQDQLLGELPRG